MLFLAHGELHLRFQLRHAKKFVIALDAFAHGSDAASVKPCVGVYRYRRWRAGGTLWRGMFL
jgi:hypothetical protein